MIFGCLLCLALFLAAPQNQASESATELLRQARNLVQQQRYSDALRTLEQCLTRDGRNVEAYKLVAISAIQIDRLDIAEPALRSAVELAPNDFQVHFHLGALHYTKSLFPLAKSEFERAIQLKPDFVPAQLFLGLTLEEIGEANKVLDTYRSAIALAESQKTAVDTAYLYLGRYLYRLNRFDESLAALLKAVEINPSGEILLALGKTLHGLKREDEAVAALQRAASVNSQDPEPHYVLFRIFSAQQREADANRELTRFHERKQEPQSDGRRRLVQSSLAPQKATQ